MRGLYIHIPFCVSKCSYCDFYSLPGRTDTIASYVQAILLEAKKYAPVSPLAPSRERVGVRGDSFPCHSESFLGRTKNLVPSPSFERRDLKGELEFCSPSIPPLRERGIKGDFSRTTSSVPFFATLYIGGGTPSLLGPQNLTTLITGLLCHSERSEESSSSHRHCERSAAIPERGGIPNQSMLVSSPSTGEDQGCRLQAESTSPPRTYEGVQLLESTIELNPESATPEFLQTVKHLGFNRLSFGVQSIDDNELQSVGRIHTAKQAIAAIQLAQKLNFPAISADLIIGLPGQTGASLHQSLETLVDMGIQHLSFYCLSLEAGTPLANNPPADLPSDDIQAQLFGETRNYLKTCGFVHYEISNFALPGYECLHNLNYWRGGEYLGLGPAAASHLNGKRFKNRANLDAYLQNPTGQTEDIEELNPKAKAAEEAMLRLRLLEEGLNIAELTAKFGSANTADIIRRLDKMVQEGLLLQTGIACRLEPSRILTSNPIFARVLKGNVGSGL